nr:MAG TPA: hypothetical protein [Caudoviricetes sp.]
MAHLLSFVLEYLNYSLEALICQALFFRYSKKSA